MKIITLTLSPAFDVHCYAPTFEACRENLATVTARDVGGKGVNVSRALTENGVENTAIVVLGEENAADFRSALAKEGLHTREILVAGRIRENITIHTDHTAETRLSFKGFFADETLLGRVEQAIGEVDEDTIVTLTGRLPEGIKMQDVQAFLLRLREKGARLVIDSRSFSLSDLIEARPWLIKPNEEEIVAYVRDSADLSDAARVLHGKGIANVMISMGARGACLACSEGTFEAKPPHVAALSTIGAGDSSIAGFLMATANGKGASEALRTAVAFGTAACLTEGTKPPTPDVVASILSAVS